MLESRILVFWARGQSPIVHTLDGAMLPCEVKGGAPYLRAGASDQHIAAAYYGIGSELMLNPRFDGQGKDIVVMGIIRDHGHHSSTL